VTGRLPRILREGAVTAKEIFKAVEAGNAS
jgi:hypothetical protein